ncbi:MAG: glycosyltransferase family 39 protein, partial [Acidobacteriota bacterium]
AVSVLAGTLAVVLAARAATRAWGRPAGIVAGLLLATHPLAVAWSSEGRAYGLLMLASAWAWERIEAVERDGGGTVGLGAAVALGCWSHALGLVAAAAAAAAALLLPATRRRTALTAIGAGLATHLPWVPIAAAQPAAATAWMTEAWRMLPAGERMAAPVRLLPPLAPFGEFLDIPSSPAWAQGGAALACVALLFAARRVRTPATLTVLPAAGLACLAWLGVPALYPGRAEAAFLAPFAGVLAAGADRRAARAAGGILVAGACVADVAALRTWSGTPPRGEQKLAAALLERLPEGGTVVVGGYWRLGLWYHLGHGRERYEIVNVPSSAAAHPGWYHDEPVVGAPIEAEAEAVASRLASTPERAAAVVSPGLTSTHPLMQMADRLGLVPALDVRGGRLYLPRRPES